MNNISAVKCLLIFLISYAGNIFAEGGSAVLSDNIKPGGKSNYLPVETKVIETGATYKWITGGEFATDEETLKTGTNLKILFDGNNGENWKSRTFSKWAKGEWATVVIDLKNEYQIEAVDIWALHDKPRDTEKADILLSLNGNDFTLHGIAKDQDDQPLKENTFIKMSCKFEIPVLSRYVELRVKRRKGASQQQIGDIVVWGGKREEKGGYIKADEKPPVDFSVIGIQSGAVLIDWSKFPVKDAKKWKIYSSRKPFKLVNEDGVKMMLQSDDKATSNAVYPLKPETTYFFGVTAVYPGGEHPEVKCVEYRTPAVMECRMFGDMLAINHFWGGGGARQKRPNDKAWEDVAVELLATTPVKQIRWWRLDPPVINKYYQHGIGMLAYPHGENIRKGTDLGINLFAGAANEPDLSGESIESYLAKQKNFYQILKKVNPEGLMAAPSSGLEDKSIEWLKKFYELGGKDCFDVLDLHTYCKISGGHKVPEGYPAGAPEAMFDNMRKIREITTKFGDGGKPLISTEFGYTDCETNNPSGKITPLIQAQYLVRGLIIHYVLGFKRVFIYSFWDEGPDPNYTEHHFGMIDYEVQKKPAFFAFQTLGRELGNCVMEKQMEGVNLPGIAYVFRDAGTKEYVTVIWNGIGDVLGKFETESADVEISDIFGKKRKLLVPDGKIFSLPYGQSPAYLRSPQPIRQLEQRRIELADKEEAEVQVEFNEKAIFLPYGKSAELKLVLRNRLQKESKVDLTVRDSKGRNVAKQALALPGRAEKTETIKFTPDMEGFALNRFILLVSFEGKYTSYAAEFPFHIRCFEEVAGASITKKVRMFGTDRNIQVISNQYIEVSFDVDCGGRVLDFIDKKKGTNQLNMDYALLPAMSSIPFAYGIWDQLNGQLKNAAYRVLKSEPGQLILEGTSKENLCLTKKWSLEKRQLKLGLQVMNKSAAEQGVSYHMHPEYAVGGTGDSVTDMILLPTGQEVTRLPFWSGLGDKKTVPLTENWWGVLDSVSGAFLRQDFSRDDWQPPRIWFGQGTYNLEMSSVAGVKLPPGKCWDAELVWTFSDGKNENYDGR